MGKRILYLGIAAIVLFAPPSAGAFQICEPNQCTSAIKNAQSQIKELENLKAEQQKHYQLQLQVWQLDQQLKQQQRLQQKQLAALQGTGQEKLVQKVAFGSGSNPSVACKEIEFLDAYGVTRVSTTDESCDEKAFHSSHNSPPRPHWEPELEARSRQLHPMDEQKRLEWLADQENRKADREQGHSASVDVRVK